MAKRRPIRKTPTRRTRAALLAPTAAAAGEKHLVYVHGICRHNAGYSDAWWEALRPHVPSLSAARRHEVLWSDLVTSAAASAAGSLRETPLGRELTAGILNPERVDLAVAIADVLADRAERELIEATAATAGDEQLLLEAAMPAAAISIPGINCIDDFIGYLTERTTRDQVIARFRGVVQPLLQGGASVDVISHSWGDRRGL